VSYDDGRIACTDDALVIRWYYFVHWANWDPGRPKKTVAFVVYLSTQRVRPVITPEDPEKAAAELAAHGVTVN
jgi:hypothetical protein